MDSEKDSPAVSLETRAREKTKNTTRSRERCLQEDSPGLSSRDFPRGFCRWKKGRERQDEVARRESDKGANRRRTRGTKKTCGSQEGGFLGSLTLTGDTQAQRGTSNLGQSRFFLSASVSRDGGRKQSTAAHVYEDRRTGN